MKKYMMLSIITSLGIFMYIKYKDGSMKRIAKNIKPMIECAIEELK